MILIKNGKIIENNSLVSKDILIDENTILKIDNNIDENCEIIDALEYGSASASMLVSAHSCSAAMPSLEAVEKFIAEEKALYGEMVVRA